MGARVGVEDLELLIVAREARGVVHVAQVLHLGQRQEPTGGAWIPHHEDGLVLHGPGFVAGTGFNAGNFDNVTVLEYSCVGAGVGLAAAPRLRVPIR